MLYVLDEPSIGLHARDNDRLIETLQALRDKGNTLLVVEHDDELMERADQIIDLGPAAGIHGGEILATARPPRSSVAKNPLRASSSPAASSPPAAAAAYTASLPTGGQKTAKARKPPQPPLRILPLASSLWLASWN